MKAPWLRETTWLGAEGVARKVRLQVSAGLRTLRASPHKTLAGFLADQMWKGATAKRVGLTVEVSHPSGATARLRAEAFPDVDAVLGV